MALQQTVQVSVEGMDCADCTRHVQSEIARLPGVSSVEVYLSTEKAVVQLDPDAVQLEDIRGAVERAGYRLASTEVSDERQSASNDFTRAALKMLGLVFGVVLFIIVVGEWLGLFETLTTRVPWPLGLAIVLIAGYPVFRNVVKASLGGRIISHTLMTLGVIAALAIGEWATAAVVVFFMRVGDYVESYTAERARRAVKDLAALAPQKARVERHGQEIEVPIEQVEPGDIVIVRPGELIPVDGEVIGGHATVNQAAITGESMPVESGPGSRVFAATLASLGGLRVRATHIGGDTTFGRVIRLVEEAEAHRGDVQRLADRFSSYYLPVVAAIGALTFLLRRDPLATAAVLVVACSCSFALATPIAMLASIGAGARQGLMIKGGKYLETLAKADVLLIDKTGTLTLGIPQITDILVNGSVFHNAKKSDNGHPTSEELLSLAASAERYSEHPLAEAIREAARERGLEIHEPEGFEAVPGQGVRARVGLAQVTVGKRAWIDRQFSPEEGAPETNGFAVQTGELESSGKTLLWVGVDGDTAGVLAAADTLRPETPQAIRMLKELGFDKIELLTGDNQRSAAWLAASLDAQNPLPYRAGLLPEDKITVVRAYQAKGHTVVMVGDGVNDAPALAQADVGIAMGAAGSDVAIEAAHIALMREDWLLVPQAIRIARRTMGIVRGNLAFTVLYNLVGLSLAAFGFLPPIFAAAAQSLPDLGILANSARLLRTSGK